MNTALDVGVSFASDCQLLSFDDFLRLPLLSARTCTTSRVRIMSLLYTSPYCVTVPKRLVGRYRGRKSVLVKIASTWRESLGAGKGSKWRIHGEEISTGRGSGDLE